MRYEIAKKYYELRPEIYDCYKSMSATCKCLKDNISLKFQQRMLMEQRVFKL